jgi:protein-S-isoprenylcysteine O-methyltransferase Ste14
MLYVIRHLLSIAALPFVVTVVVPYWVTRRAGVTLAMAAEPLGFLGQILGVVVLATGLVLFATSLRRFATEGQGTLAPWDPPRRLVLRGPYRYVRNPMISGVIFILLGEALLLRSQPVFLWALTFIGINLLYIPIFEEPQLRGRFGVDYVEYCRNVRRFLPRLTPWQGQSPSGA